MQNRSLQFMTVLAFAVITAAFAYAAPVIGKPAPAFSGQGSDGKTYSLADFKGKFVVLEWFNNGCPFVKKHYEPGNMQRLQDVYAQKGVVWLSINSSAKGKEGNLSPEQALQVRNDWKMKSDVIILDANGKIGAAYEAKTTPHMFIINPQGILIYQGAIDDHNSTDSDDIPKSKNYVSAALDEALAGKPVSTSSTRPYGCSVKYK